MVQLSRQRVMNALNHEMILDITKQLREWKHCPDHISCILLLADFSELSSPVFCAGGDIRGIE